MFIQKTVEFIQERKPLVDNCEEFNKVFKPSTRMSYMSYLDDYILDTVGKEEFKNYLNDLIQTMIIKNDDSLKSVLTNEDILVPIFGPRVTQVSKIGYREYNNKNARPNRLKKIIISIIIPYTIGSYLSKSNRNQVYKQINASSEEIDEYESLFTKSISNKASISSQIRAISADFLFQSKLPHNHTFEDVCRVVDKEISLIIENGRACPPKSRILKMMLNAINKKDPLRTDLLYIMNSSSLNAKLMVYIENKILDSQKYFYENNFEECNLDKDCYTVYENRRGIYISHSIDMSLITSESIKQDIRKYLRSGCTTINESFIRNLLDIIFAFTYFQEFGITSSYQVNEFLILSLVQHKEKDVKIIRVKRIIKALYDYYEFLIENAVDAVRMDNPAMKIRLYGQINHTHTNVIPEDIRVFLDEHIEEVTTERDILIYKVLISTGWRISDLRKIETHDIILDKSGEYAWISVLTSKTKKQRIKRRLGATLIDIINIELYDRLQSYIKKTIKVRERYNIKTLFYRVYNNRVLPLDVESFNKAINKLLKKYNIISYDENFEIFTSRQTRKTVASVLISNGMPPVAVQQKLGHVCVKTTEQYYAEVSLKRIQDLNDAFFNEKFSIYLDEEKLRLFTEEERRILYVDFCTNIRNVEIGFCTKHASEGRCTNLGFSTCANCPKLCTGKLFLPKWKALQKDSRALIEEYLRAYKQNGIAEDEYSNFIEYKQEVRLFQQYSSVIEAIENENK